MSFRGLLINEVDLLTASGVNAEGTPVFHLVGSGIAARVEYRNQQIIGFDGEELFSDSRAFMEPLSFTLHAGDQLVYNEEYFTILTVHPVQNTSTVHHLELLMRTSRRLE